MIVTIKFIAETILRKILNCPISGRMDHKKVLIYAMKTNVNSKKSIIITNFKSELQKQ